MALRVTIAEDNLIVREGIAQILAGEPGVEVVALCSDLDEVLRAVDRDRPDVLITDIRMPPTMTDEGIRIAAHLRKSHPDIGVIVLSQYADAAYALALLEHGSHRRSYLLKERVHDRSQLRAAIESVAHGGSVIDPKVVDGLLAARAAVDGSRLRELTARELEVLAEIAQGRSNAAIAASLVLTKRAVEKHINSIFLKLGLAHVDDLSKRVKAALLFLAESRSSER